MPRSNDELSRGRTTTAGSQCWLCERVAVPGEKFRSAGKKNSKQMLARFRAFVCTMEHIPGKDGGWVVDGYKWNDVKKLLCSACLFAPLETPHLQEITAAREKRSGSRSLRCAAAPGPCLSH
jgi:hypothetical protein